MCLFEVAVPPPYAGGAATSKRIFCHLAAQVATLRADVLAEEATDGLGSRFPHTGTHAQGWCQVMISLTRLSGSVFVLNADLIERLDRTPDTVITLVDGKKYVVAETMDQVVDAVRAYRGLLIATSQLPLEPAPPSRPHLAPVTELTDLSGHPTARQEAD